MSSTVSVDSDAFGVLYSRHREEVLWDPRESSPGPDLVAARGSEESRRMQALASAWQRCRRLDDDQRTPSRGRLHTEGTVIMGIQTETGNFTRRRLQS